MRLKISRKICFGAWNMNDDGLDEWEWTVHHEGFTATQKEKKEDIKDLRNNRRTTQRPAY